jgi:hypothetical protein
MHLPPVAWGGKVCGEGVVAEVLRAEQPVVANAGVSGNALYCAHWFLRQSLYQTFRSQAGNFACQPFSWFAFVTKLHFVQVIGCAARIYRCNVNLMLKIEGLQSIRYLPGSHGREIIFASAEHTASISTREVLRTTRDEAGQ